MSTGYDDNCDEFSHSDLINRLKLKGALEDTGGTIQIKLRPSDTFPYICKIMNQNVNSLGNKTEDKLEQIIEIMIKRQINGYCIQETWQLYGFTLTIQEHTIFHHEMKKERAD